MENGQKNKPIDWDAVSQRLKAGLSGKELHCNECGKDFPEEWKLTISPGVYKCCYCRGPVNGD